MIYTRLTKLALNICFNAHKEQYDKSGVPYVFHPFYLATKMEDEYSTCVALLHDVVEDTDITLEELAKDFPNEVIEALSLLTHDLDVPYFDYVLKIKENKIAKAVKLADLGHNSDLTRMENPTEWDLKRQEKYLKAIELLKE